MNKIEHEVENEYDPYSGEDWSDNKASHRKLVFGCVLIVLALLAACAAHLVSREYQNVSSDQAQVGEQAGEEDKYEPKGTLVLSAILSEDSDRAYQSFFATVADDNNTVFPFFDEAVRLRGATFPDANDHHKFYVVANSAESADTYAIHAVDLTQSGSEQTKYLEATDVQQEQHIAVHPETEQIAFVGYDAAEVSDDTVLDLDQLSVYVYDQATAENTLLDNGAYPQWSPSGNELVYLKSDGLYVYNLSTDSSTKIYNVAHEVLSGSATSSSEVVYIDATLDLRSMIKVSPDKTMLLWTTPEYGATLFTIDWEQAQLRDDVALITKNQSTSLFWPVFSPDSLSFAVLNKGEKEEETYLNQVQIYSVDMELVREVDIDSAVYQEIILDDWIY